MGDNVAYNPAQDQEECVVCCTLLPHALNPHDAGAVLRLSGPNGAPSDDEVAAFRRQHMGARCPQVRASDGRWRPLPEEDWDMGPTTEAELQP